MNMTGMDKALRIIIVEDESMVAMLLEDMLEDLGHQVVATVGSMDKAEQLVAGEAFDLAILDVNLNGEHTYPLATKLKERGAPFLFSTGYGRSGLLPEWRESAVLQKPFTERDLAKAIQAAVDGSGC